MLLQLQPALPAAGILAEEEAQRGGLKNGDEVLVESRTGSVLAKLEVRAGQRGDILVAERGGWLKAGHGLNRLTRDTVAGLYARPARGHPGKLILARNEKGQRG